MNEIVTGVIVAVVAGIILSWFGLNKHTTVVRVGGNLGTPKKWKVMIVIGWILTIFGGWYSLAWGLESGLSDYHTGMGLSSFILGIPILLLGKFGTWWNR